MMVFYDIDFIKEMRLRFPAPASVDTVRLGQVEGDKPTGERYVRQTPIQFLSSS
jgi:hypothetical protein